MAVNCETWDTFPNSLLVGAEWGLLPGSGWRPCSLSSGQGGGLSLIGTAIPLRKVLGLHGCVSRWSGGELIPPDLGHVLEGAGG